MKFVYVYLKSLERGEETRGRRVHKGNKKQVLSTVFYIKAYVCAALR